jgi:hypothetical protein
MADDKGLLEIIHRLITDGDYRAQFTMTPRETITTELGISGETYDTLVAMIPVLLASGLLTFLDGGSGDPTGQITAPLLDWGDLIMAPVHDWGGRFGV